MTHDRTPESEGRKLHQAALASSYYALLGIHPSASAREVRQAYRELSKLYHPDTTKLPSAIATEKFQKLNEAYATLSSAERRLSYDQKIGYSRLTVVQPLPSLNSPSAQTRRPPSSSAYLDPTDRPLSAGEIFALFILGLTFVACLVLAITIGLTRGDSLLSPVTGQPAATEVQVVSPDSASVQSVTVHAPTTQDSVTQKPTPQKPTGASAKETAPTPPTVPTSPTVTVPTASPTRSESVPSKSSSQSAAVQPVVKAPATPTHSANPTQSVPDSVKPTQVPRSSLPITQQKSEPEGVPVEKPSAPIAQPRSVPSSTSVPLSPANQEADPV